MRIRVIALAGLLAALLLGAGTFMMSRSSTDTGADPSTAPVAQKPKPKSSVPADSGAAPAEAEAKAASPVTKPASPAAPTAEPAVDLETGLPTPVVKALQTHQVVVLSLVSPGSAVDQLAAAEASAGAKRAGVGFVKITVADRKDLKRLTAELQVRHTPSLLVFTRPDRLFVQVKGFADRETVAQAATNAS